MQPTIAGKWLKCHLSCIGNVYEPIIQLLKYRKSDFWSSASQAEVFNWLNDEYIVLAREVLRNQFPR